MLLVRVLLPHRHELEVFKNAHHLTMRSPLNHAVRGNDRWNGQHFPVRSRVYYSAIPRSSQAGARQNITTSIDDKKRAGRHTVASVASNESYSAGQGVRTCRIFDSFGMGRFDSVDHLWACTRKPARMAPRVTLSVSIPLVLRVIHHHGTAHARRSSLITTNVRIGNAKFYA